MSVAFEDLHPQSRQFIQALSAHIHDGTHSSNIIRYSGDTSDPRSRIIQKSLGTEPDHIIYMEGYSAGDSFNRLIGRGLIKGGWVSADTWEGTVEPSAVETYSADPEVNA